MRILTSTGILDTGHTVSLELLLLLFAIKMATRPFWAEIKNLRTCYCAPYKLVSFSPTNMIVSDLERYDIGLPEYVKM